MIYLSNHCSDFEKTLAHVKNHLLHSTTTGKISRAVPELIRRDIFVVNIYTYANRTNVYLYLLYI